MAHRADGMAKTSAALKKIADAGAPLYQSLTDEQKARFKTLGRMLQPHHRRMAFNEGNDGWRGRGFGRMTARASDIIGLARTTMTMAEVRESSSKHHSNCGGAR